MSPITFGKNKAAAPKAAPPAAASKGKAIAAQASGAAASLLPEDFVSGGLLNDVDVDITDCTFVDDWTYNGAVADPVLALRVTFFDPDKKEETVQHFSAGDLARWVPSPDGKQVVPAEGSQAKALNNNTNCASFLQSIMDAGFPKKLVSSRIDVFEGMNVHVNRVPQQKRSGIVQADDKQRDVLVVTKINSLPGEAKLDKVNGRAGKATPTAQAQAAPAAAGEEIPEDLMLAAAEVIGAAITDKGGTISAKALPLAILKHLAGNAQRAEILVLAKNVEFLGAEGVPWTFDGTNLTA